MPSAMSTDVLIVGAGVAGLGFVGVVSRAGMASVHPMWISSGSVTRKLCLVIGMVMPRISASWKASVPIEALGTWPVIATIGTESI